MALCSSFAVSAAAELSSDLVYADKQKRILSDAGHKPVYKDKNLKLEQLKNSKKEDSSGKDIYTPLKIFTQSLHFIETHYPEPIDRRELIPRAVQGMLSQLDPHSQFLTPDQLDQFYKKNKSHFEGLGIQVILEDNRFIVTHVFKNSGAYKKNLRAGDAITHINGEPMRRGVFDSWSRKIKKQAGGFVVLGIKRSEENLEISVPLKKIETPSMIGFPISKNFFYIRIFSFRENTYREFKKILQKFQCPNRSAQLLCPKFSGGLLIDLRNNAGGLIDPALLIADLFISEGLLISIQGKLESYNRKFYAKNLGALTSFPIVVLINSYTASAGEILASALKDNLRAFIAGQKSFGKGSIQTIFRLEDGYALKLTSARYAASKGRPIEGAGIEPHLYLKPPWIFYKNLKKIEDIKSQLKKKQGGFRSRFNSIGNPSVQWKSIAQNDPELRMSLKILQHLLY